MSTTIAATESTNLFTKRWSLFNTRTNSFGRSYKTRALARARKTKNQKIYDNREGTFVR